MNLDQTVREASARFGERSAYVSPTGWEMSYACLDRLADEVSAGLAAEGVREGSVVAAVMPPRPEYVVAQVATARVGATFAGINHKLSFAERTALLELCDPTMVIEGREAASSEDEALADLRIRSAAPPRLIEDADRPLAIVFTSGTTAAPRGAVFAQRQIDFITQVETGQRWGDPGQPAPHGTSAMSLTHLGPTTKLQAKLMRGGTTHLLEQWSPGTALEMVQRHRMPSIAGVPTQIALMLQHADFGRFDLSSLQAVVMGGGPASASLIREARDRLDAAVMVRYSCTEAGIGTATSATDDPADAECSVGRPHAGVELTIRDRTGHPLRVGETGEVCLSSPAAMSGYWRDPESTEAARWSDGAVRTGDLGHVDDRGRLRLTGRSGDMYVRGGYNVHPNEVEAALADFPGVANLAVVPRSDDIMGDIGVVAVVVEPGRPPPTLEKLRSFGESRLARHKLPEDLLVLDALPLTPMEKLDRRALADLVDQPTEKRDASDSVARS